MRGENWEEMHEKVNKRIEMAQDFLVIVDPDL